MAVRSKPLTQTQKNEILQKDSSDTQAGSVARYCQLNKDTGIKLYRVKAVRDMCFARQELAYDLDFAPNCWHPFRLRIWGVLWHGFYTEHATIAAKMDVVDSEDYQEGLDFVNKMMNENFRGMHDLHYENWGSIDGRWVVIDFSHLEDAYGELSRIRPRWRSYKCREDIKTLR